MTVRGLLRVALGATVIVDVVLGCWWMLHPEPTQPRASPSARPVERVPPHAAPRRRAADPPPPPEVEEPVLTHPPGPWTAPARLVVRIETTKQTPVAGASVVATDSDGRRHLATSDAAGVAKIEDQLPPLRTEILVNAPGFAPRRVTQSVLAPGTETSLHLQLASSTSVEGVVLETDGRPLSGARVFVGDGEDYPAETLSGYDGRFRIDGVPDDGLTGLRCEARLHMPATASPPFDAKAGAVIRLDAGARIYGAVCDPSGAPAGGARIRASSGGGVDWYAIADDYGRYVLDGLPLGRAWSVAATHQRFGDAPAVVATLDAACAERSIDLALRAPGRLVVNVLDDDGRPARGARVNFPWTSDVSRGSVLVDAEGRATRAVSSDGAWEIGATTDVSEAPDTRVDVVVGETRTVELRLAKRVAVSGVVVDDDGRPVAGAGVSAFARASTLAMTASDGSFRIDGIPAGPCKLIAQSVGLHGRFVVDVSAPASDVRIVFAREGRVALCVRAPAGAPRPVAAYVSFSRAGDVGPRLQLGIVEASLPPGRWRAVVRAMGYAPATCDFDVAAGATTTPDEIELDVGATLAGRVVDDDGRPVPRAELAVDEDAARSDDKGEFVVEHLPRSGAPLTIQASGFAETTVEWTPAAASPFVVTLHRVGGK